MIEQFPNVVDLKFTAAMEGDLDEIASGQRPWQPTVRELYNPLSEALLSAEDAPAVVQETGETCPECEKPLIRRFGRFGPFFACSGFPECRYTRPDESEPEQTTDEKCDVCASAMVVKRAASAPSSPAAATRSARARSPSSRRPASLAPPTAVRSSSARPARAGISTAAPTIRSASSRAGSARSRTVCPDCGGLIVAERGRRVHCTACEWKGPASAARPRSEGLAPAGVA